MTRIAFVYNRRHRLVDDPQVRFTKDRNLIITGTDADHGKVRTFRVDRIVGPVRKMRYVGGHASEENVSRDQGLPGVRQRGCVQSSLPGVLSMPTPRTEGRPRVNLPGLRSACWREVGTVPVVRLPRQR